MEARDFSRVRFHIGPEVDKCHPGWVFIILGNQEPAIMKAGKDISKAERDYIIDQIENW